MSDGLFIAPILDGDRVVGWTRSTWVVPGAALHKSKGTDFKYLRYRNGEVVEISEEEKAEILANEQAAAEAQAAALAQQEAEAQAAAEEYEKIRRFSISKLQLIRKLRELGKEEAFYTWLYADLIRRRDWDNAVELYSDDALVVDAMIDCSVLLFTDEQLAEKTDDEKILMVRDFLKTYCQPV